jgi:hypothetical protein
VFVIGALVGGLIVGEEEVGECVDGCCVSGVCGAMVGGWIGDFVVGDGVTAALVAFKAVTSLVEFELFVVNALHSLGGFTAMLHRLGKIQS